MIGPTPEFTEDDRIAVLTALANEVIERDAGRPHMPAVIQSCEMILRANLEDNKCGTRTRMSDRDEQGTVYWWQRD